MSQTESKAIVAASAAVGAALGAIIAWKIAKKPYTPPKVWAAPKPGGSKFASINAPTAGAREVKALPKGKHPLQLYSLGTPNGVKARPRRSPIHTPHEKRSAGHHVVVRRVR